MGQTPVTVGAYKRYSLRTGKAMPPEPDFYGRELNPGWRNELQPIVRISWDQAGNYCASAGMRLPFEAEWEYAARAATREARYGTLDDIAWYADNSGTQPLDTARNEPFVLGINLMNNRNEPKIVGQKLPNAWKLYDILGNVSQWTADWYGEKYYDALDGQDPQGPPGGERRVLRGGWWGSKPSAIRVSSRNQDEPVYQRINHGFRCVGE